MTTSRRRSTSGTGPASAAASAIGSGEAGGTDGIGGAGNGRPGCRRTAASRRARRWRCRCRMVSSWSWDRDTRHCGQSRSSNLGFAVGLVGARAVVALRASVAAAATMAMIPNEVIVGSPWCSPYTHHSAPSTPTSDQVAAATPVGDGVRHTVQIAGPTCIAYAAGCKQRAKRGEPAERRCAEEHDEPTQRSDDRPTGRHAAPGTTPIASAASANDIATASGSADHSPDADAYTTQASSGEHRASSWSATPPPRRRRRARAGAGRGGHDGEQRRCERGQLGGHRAVRWWARSLRNGGRSTSSRSSMVGKPDPARVETT